MTDHRSTVLVIKLNSPQSYSNNDILIMIFIIKEFQIVDVINSDIEIYTDTSILIIR